MILIKQKTENLKFDNITDLARIKAYKIKNLEHGYMLSLPKTFVCSWMTVVSVVDIELRLGCQLCRHFTCACGEVVDQEGPHPLSCKNAGQKNS